ncbi:MAG: acyl-CoA dehydrogenase C-terminal domain-containing protein [Alphaproteobacteria bacterium]|nr:acyl-CoA dehydrogenase C-terminal domain-containing protein [Alphaproteobacteria bacterium]
MPTYTAPLDDIRFVLHEMLNVEQLSEIEEYAETASSELIDQILEEGAKICQEALFPINLSGDQEGCHFENGKVTTPKGFKEAYDLFTESGWTGVSCDPKYGGMGLPHTVNFVMQEMICSANLSFGMYPGLSQGAIDAIYLHGTDEQKDFYLPKMIEGKWSGTMNLTESHCGTDLGLIRTKAEVHKDGNGAWAITGQKIFISAGEHDLTDNIIHLVLARLPDAPDGVRGISLFIVPKFITEENDKENTLSCTSIEHKMGIKASSTCVMDFQGAKGFLLGEPHKGLKAMFTMMNAARLAVGMQGLGMAEVSYQNAVAYAKDRLQMRSLDGTKFPDKPADPIIVHPDVRRMLLTSKAVTEGCRMMSYWIGMNLDIAEKSKDAKEAEKAEDLVALLTPIAKAYQTDMGFEIANLAIQTHGGAGYIGEFGVEQYARDARITMIYEGTNGIQALDLVGRKLGQNMGRNLRRFFHPVTEYIEKNQANPALAEFIFPFAKSVAKLQQSTATIAQKGMKDPLEAGAASVDYLRQFALVSLAYMWIQMVEKSLERIESGEGDTKFYEQKIRTARFFFTRMLPETDARFKMIMAGATPLMETPAEAF